MNVWQENRLTADILENRLIKAALHQLLAFLSLQTTSPQEELRAGIAKLWSMFDEVEVCTDFRGLDDWLPSAIQRLPPKHRPYIPALWLAYLLVARRGVSVERIGDAVFDTFLINAADLFEDYARILLREAIASLSNLEVKDGNEFPVPLFVTSNEFTVKPDIYVLADDKAVVVLDAKYKLDVKATDRYEILSFCEALKTQLAIAILPGESAVDAVQSIGQTARGVHLYRTNLNLSAAEMVVEESRFKTSLAHVIQQQLS